MTTLATLDGSLRTVELGTLEAIELCETIARTSGRAARNIPVWATISTNNIAAIEAYSLSQSDDEQTELDAREALEDLMRDTESAMYDLGYLAYWEDGWFYLETIDCDESDTE